MPAKQSHKLRFTPHTLELGKTLIRKVDQKIGIKRYRSAHLIYASFFFLVLSCKHDPYRNVGVSFKTKYYPNGKVKEELPYLKNDTVIHGFRKFYNSDGTLKKVIQYKYGLKDGILKCFYSTGQLKYVTTYKKDTLDTAAVQYYRNGHIEAVNWFSDNRLSGNQLEYNIDGGIEIYRYVNISGETLFEIYYNPNGLIDSIKGHGPTEGIYNKSHLRIGENAVVIYYFGLPPGFKYSILLDDGDSTQDISHKFVFHGGNSGFLFERKMTKSGSRRIAFISKFWNDRGKVIKDTNAVNFVIQ